MPSVRIKLKMVGKGKWQLFSPNGNAISQVFRGKKHHATEWAKAWCSSWTNWTVDTIDVEDGENDDDKEGTVF